MADPDGDDCTCPQAPHPDWRHATLTVPKIEPIEIRSTEEEKIQMELKEAQLRVHLLESKLLARDEAKRLANMGPEERVWMEWRRLKDASCSTAVMCPRCRASTHRCNCNFESFRIKRLQELGVPPFRNVPPGAQWCLSAKWREHAPDEPENVATAGCLRGKDYEAFFGEPYYPGQEDWD